jgi:transcriptional regulator with XRE-family HTH domain
LREKKGYSQEYMSDILNISQQTYSLTEKHPEKANLGRIKEIAKILEVKVSFLLNEDESFVLNTFNQQGHAISLVHSISNEDAYKSTINQMQSEIDFLRKMLEKNTIIS